MSSPSLEEPPDSALQDEIEAINSIYGDGTITLTAHSAAQSTAVLKPPSQPFTFQLQFDAEYPSTPPTLNGLASSGDSAKGEGETAISILAEVLGRIYTPGLACLFDLIEEASPQLAAQYGSSGPEHSAESQSRSDTSAVPPLSQVSADVNQNLTLNTQAPSAFPHPAPQWTTSQPLTVQKSTFLAHAAPCTSRAQALAYISVLISSSKKIANATHNITAFRIVQQHQHQYQQPESEAPTYIQDCDDDGESAAGGRLLHLLQLMDAVDVVIVVTRWYGGVKLGGERFRCIGNVAREVLVVGGWGRKEEGGGKKGKGKK